MLENPSHKKEEGVKSPSFVDDKPDTLEKTALPFENVYGFVKEIKKTNMKKKKKK